MDAVTQLRAVQVARLALLATAGGASRPPQPAALHPPLPAGGGGAHPSHLGGHQRRRRGPRSLSATARDAGEPVPYAHWAKAASRRRGEGPSGGGGAAAASSLFAESAEMSGEPQFGDETAGDRANSAPRWFANAGKAHTYDVRARAPCARRPGAGRGERALPIRQYRRLASWQRAPRARCADAAAPRGRYCASTRA